MPIIYRATCKTTNLSYIGSSKKTLLERKSKHKGDLGQFLRDKPCAKKFYQHIIDYGFNNFDWDVLETLNDDIEDDLLLEREGYYQRLHDTVKKGLNLNYAYSSKEQRRIKDNLTRQERRRKRKMYCEICDKHYNYDSHQEHINSKNHQNKIGNYEYKCKGNEKEYFAKRYKRLKEERLKKVKCEVCDRFISYSGMNRHNKTKKHLSNLSNIRS